MSEETNLKKLSDLLKKTCKELKIYIEMLN